MAAGARGRGLAGRRLWGLAVGVAAGACLICTAALWVERQGRLEEQARAYGEAVLGALAELLAEPVLQGDLLSLTVLARRLQAGTPIARLEIYDVNRQLLAQAGEAPGAYAFSRQLSYRDAAVGHVTISLEAPAGGLGLLGFIPWLLVGGLAAGLWGWRREAFDWLAQENPPAERELADKPEAGATCLLACRVWPAPLAARYAAAFAEAVRVTHGVAETGGRGFTARFGKPEDAAEAALLLRALVAEAGASLRCGAALGLAEDDAAGARKRLAHIASLAEGLVVADSGLAAGLAGKGHRLESFSHSLLDTENLVQLGEGEPAPGREALAKALLESHRLAPA